MARYSPRPGTAAARAFPDDVPAEVKKEREKILTEILKQTALDFNKKFIGQEVDVLVEGVKKGKLIGKNRQFKTVTFAGSKDLIGQFVKGKITDATAWGLRGEMINR